MSQYNPERDVAFYNRLGVILAMKKQEYRRAQELIQQALDLAPGNATYQHNLSKVLAMEASASVGKKEGDDGKKKLLGFLQRKK